VSRPSASSTTSSFVLRHRAHTAEIWFFLLAPWPYRRQHRARSASRAAFAQPDKLAGMMASNVFPPPTNFWLERCFERTQSRTVNSDRRRRRQMDELLRGSDNPYRTGLGYHNRTIRRHCAPRAGIPHKDAPRARLGHLSRS